MQYKRPATVIAFAAIVTCGHLSALAAPSASSSFSSFSRGSSSSAFRSTSGLSGRSTSRGVARTSPFDPSINVPSFEIDESDDPATPLGLAFRPDTPQTPALQHMLHELNNLLEDKHKEQARLLIQDFRSHHPADVSFFGNVALHYATHHDYKEALAMVAEGLNHFPHSLPLHKLDVQIYLTSGDSLQAEKQLQICIGLQPHSEMLHKELAQVYIRHHKPLEALKEIDHAIEIDKHHVSSWQARGALLLELHHKEEALAAFNQAIQLTHPPADTYDLRKTRGPLLESLGHYKAAIEDYQYLLKINPGLKLRALTHIGNCYLALKQPHEALQYFDLELKKKPNYLRAHRGRLAAYEALGDGEAAAKERSIVSNLHEDWDAEH